ncbi:MAG: DUF2474 family protein [Burkholderiales bacterium]|nr:DUF2474 family protein [Burkholderiales bacterium]
MAHSHWFKRSLWFVGLWLGGVASMAAVASVIRALSHLST